MSTTRLHKPISITWRQVKDIKSKRPTCSLYSQAQLLAGSNKKGTQNIEIWQMEVFHFVEFGKLKYVCHINNTY